jgi:hypothetical protein
MKIALVSCAKSKRNAPARADDLYTSPLFLKSRAWARRHCDQWIILSAKHGLLAPEVVIAPYERTLKGMPRADVRRWEDEVYQQMRERGLLVLHAANTFVWLAGQDYQRDLRERLAGFMQEDPLEGLRFGPRMRWLDENI